MDYSGYIGGSQSHYQTIEVPSQRKSSVVKSIFSAIWSAVKAVFKAIGWLFCCFVPSSSHRERTYRVVDSGVERRGMQRHSHSFNQRISQSVHVPASNSVRGQSVYVPPPSYDAHRPSAPPYSSFTSTVVPPQRPGTMPPSYSGLGHSNQPHLRGSSAYPSSAYVPPQAGSHGRVRGSNMVENKY